MFDWLQGFKTYIVSAGAILTAVGAYLHGSISLTDLVSSIFAASTAMTLRAGIAKAGSGK
jgi:hypothetical protein